MNKNRKIMALVCALSMIFSVFAGFSTIAKAANEGITLSSVTAKDRKSATVTATYSGFEDGIANYTLVLNMPSDKVASIEAVSGYKGAAPIENYMKEQNIYKFVIGGTFDEKPANNVLATFKLNFVEPLAEDLDIALQNDSTIGNGANTIFLVAKDENGTLEKSSVTVLADPNATPKPIAPDRPVVGDDVQKPVVKDPVPVGENGIELASAIAKDKKSATITATYKGFPDGIANYTLVLNMPSDKVDSVTAVSGYKGAAPIENYMKEQNLYKFVIGGTFDEKPANNVLATFTVNFKDALAEDLEFALQNDSTIGNGANTIFLVAKDENGTLPKVFTTVKATDGASFKNTTDAEKMGVDSSVIVTEDDKTDGTTPYYAVMTATKGKNPAVYGTDYIAYYGDTPLTEDQMNAYLTGKWGSVKDALANMKFAYNAGVSLKLDLCNDNVETVLSSGNVGGGSGDKEPTAKKIVINPTGPSSITVGSKATIKTTITNEDKEDGVLSVKIKSRDSLDAVSGAGIQIVPADPDADVDMVTTADKVINVTDQIKFTGAVKGKVELVYTYTGTDNLGKEQTVTATKTVTVKEKSEPGNSSDSSSDKNGSMGPIANANGNLNGTGTVPGGFSDLGSVAWAQEAIVNLSARGIISGRGDGIFDPNANITRAEYCQILVGAIAKSQEAADSSFADVASDAWYYHAVSVASKYGIVSGYGDGNFGPNNLITRQDMALMTYKAAQVMGTNLSAKRSMNFADQAAISAYAAEAVTTLANATIINGVSATEFDPMNFATRAQAAVILYQTFVK